VAKGCVCIADLQTELPESEGVRLVFFYDCAPHVFRTYAPVDTVNTRYNETLYNEIALNEIIAYYNEIPRYYEFISNLPSFRYIDVTAKPI
jgi:hypothetical protein